MALKLSWVRRGHNALEKLHRDLDVNADRQLAFYQMGVVVPLDLNQISV
jgi:hypothetical protein